MRDGTGVAVLPDDGSPPGAACRPNRSGHTGSPSTGLSAIELACIPPSSPWAARASADCRAESSSLRRIPATEGVRWRKAEGRGGGSALGRCTPENVDVTGAGGASEVSDGNDASLAILRNTIFRGCGGGAPESEVDMLNPT